MGYSGLLYSQVGYDMDNPKRAIVRGDSADTFSGAAFRVTNCDNNNVALSGELAYWGEKWNSFWWVIDFTEIESAGNYQITVTRDGKTLYTSDRIKIGQHLLWNETLIKVGLESFENRYQLTRNHIGWMDCGSYLREACSHALAVIGLDDLLEWGFMWLDESEVKRLANQLLQGCKYLISCCDNAERLGFPVGSMVHEIPNDMIVLPQDSMLAAVAMARTSRLLAEIYPEFSTKLLKYAKNAFEYIKEAEHTPFYSNSFANDNHGAPPDYVPPDDEWMTRELMLQLAGAVELMINGLPGYKEEAVILARRVMERQIPQSENEDGLYGHFYTYPDKAFSEKSNVHHHVGHDTGGVLPYYIWGLMELAIRFHDHEDTALWEKSIRDFAYGFFLPACSQNPFYLVPIGYFPGEGVLNFCGPWHGINSTVCFASSLATRLEFFFKDSAFRDIAVGNLQWIAGLNAGITKDSFEGYCMWRVDIPEGEAVPYSQIECVGLRSIRGWVGVEGSIPSGFSRNPQFTFEVPSKKENDEPKLYADEDWVPHAGAFVGALANMRMWRQMYPENNDIKPRSH